MNARLLLALFDSVYLLALSAWMGGLLFFTIGLAPLIAAEAGSERGGKLLRLVIPRLYGWGATLGAIALASLVCGPLSVPELRGRRVLIQAVPLLVGTLLMLYAANSLAPALLSIQAEGTEEGRDRRMRLHRRGARLNVLVLILGAGLLIAFATRPAPRTAGILEPTPQERTRRELDRLQQGLGRRGASIRTPRAPGAAGVSTGGPGRMRGRGPRAGP